MEYQGWLWWQLITMIPSYPVFSLDADPTWSPISISYSSYWRCYHVSLIYHSVQHYIFSIRNSSPTCQQWRLRRRWRQVVQVKRWTPVKLVPLCEVTMETVTATTTITSTSIENFASWDNTKMIHVSSCFIICLVFKLLMRGKVEHVSCFLEVDKSCPSPASPKAVQHMFIDDGRICPETWQFWSVLPFWDARWCQSLWWLCQVLVSEVLEDSVGSTETDAGSPLFVTHGKHVERQVGTQNSSITPFRGSPWTDMFSLVP